MAHDVFISHSSKDKTVADAVCALLERRGHRCWMAPRDILPGREWGEAIIDGISGARIFVLIFSGNANFSQQVRREVERAAGHGVPIIPFRIEDVPPAKSLEYFISSSHWLDALSPPMERHIERLADAAGRLLDPAPVAPADAHGPIAAVPRAPADGAARDVLPVAAIAAVPLAGAVGGVSPPWPDGIGFVSAALVVLAAMLAWRRLRQGPSRRARGWLVAAGLATGGGLVAYFALYSLFVEPVPGSDVRVVRGYVCTPEAELVYKEACPNLPRDSLRDAEWESVMLWTRSSVTIVRTALLASWLLFTAGLMAAAALVLNRGGPGAMERTN